MFNPRNRKGGTPIPNFFGLESELLDQLPETLVQLFLDNEYMF